MAAGVDDGFVAVEDAIAELVLPQILPDVFGWVEFGRVGRQFEQTDVVRYFELATGLMPTGAVEQYNCMAAAGNMTANFGEVQVHHLAVGDRQDESGTGIACGTDGAK